MRHLTAQFEPCIVIKQTPHKGLGVFAKKRLGKNKVVLYYKCKIIDNSDYVSHDDTYRMTVPRWLNKHLLEKKIDPCTYVCDVLNIPDDIPYPCDGIPFWGFLVNEPSRSETENLYTDDIMDEDMIEVNGAMVTSKALLRRIKSKSAWLRMLDKGVYVTYIFKTKHSIKKGSELLWGYGDTYDRDYETST